MILEELTQTNAILLYLSLDLEDKLFEGGISNESPLLSNVLVLLGLVKLFHFLLEGKEWSAIIDELEILNLVIISSIYRLDSVDFLV